MSLSIRVEGAREASAWLKSFRTTNALVRGSDLSAPIIVAALRKEAPYRERGTDYSESAAGEHKHLRDSIATARHTTVGSVTRVFTSDDEPIATFVIGGTKPHGISNLPDIGRTPRTPWRSATGGARTVLHWISSGGDDVFVPQSAQPVQHPGTQPNPFPRRVWEAVGAAVLDYYRRELTREWSPHG